MDEFLTLTLPDRIQWLHGNDGPRGKMSHDRFAAMLGTNRQTVIAWEKGQQPGRDYAEKLAAFSGFPAEAFRRRSAEAAASASSRDLLRRLRELEEREARHEQETRAFASAVVRRLDALEEALGIAAPASAPEESGDPL